MSNTLLPCPFCGGEAEVTTRDVEPQGDPWYGKNIQTFVICTNCGACLFDDFFHEGFVDEHEATTAWNRRSDAVPVVRCGECKNFSPRNLVNFCSRTGRTCENNDFCSYGAKMEDKPCG